MSKRIGRQTVRLAEGAVILSAASTVGPKEAEGPLGKYFDQRARMRFLGRLHGSCRKQICGEKHGADLIRRQTSKRRRSIIFSAAIC